MQQMGDDEAANVAKALKEKIQKRQELSSLMGLFVPTIHVQLNLNTLSYSDLSNYLRFIEQLEKFHEQKRLYFYPKIFAEKPVSSEQWNTFGLAYFRDEVTINWFRLFLPILIISALCLIYAKINFHKKKLS